MGGVSSCGDSPSPQLGAQNQVFSQVVQWKNVPLSPSSRSSSLRLINPFSAGGWAGWEPLPLCSWDFVCEVFLLNCAGIPSWTEWARDTLALCWCQQRSEQRLCHHKSWWLHCGVASSGFGLVWKGNKVFPNSKNTLWKAWSFSVLLVFLVKAVQDNLFHSGCSSTTLSLISVLFWSYHMAGWELLNCTDGMLGTVGKRATSSTINLNAYISPLEIPYFVKA